MSEIDQLKQGAEILQQVDVTDIITALAVGIADAQEKLDNNSIKQALALANPDNGIGGKSLLSMGFAPPFYHFQYADVSAEIALKMRLQTEFELDASLSFNYTKQGGYSADKLDYLRQDESDKSRSEFKSSRSFITHASNYEDLTIESEKVKMDETKGAVSRIEHFSDQIRSNQRIDRVSVDIKDSNFQVSEFASSNSDVIVQNIGGYIVITVPGAKTVDEGILKVTSYNENDPTEIEFSGTAGTGNEELSIGQNELTDFYQVFGASESIMVSPNNSVIGFNAANSVYYVSDANAGNNVGGNGKLLEVYFDYDKDDAALTLGKTLSDSGFVADNLALQPILLKLAQALASDPLGEIKITGFTDGSGSNGYNEGLSERRAESLKNWFKTKGVKDNQIKTSGKGEILAGGSSAKKLEFRKVQITFTSTADYFYYSGVLFNATNADTSDTINEFIYLKAAPQNPGLSLGVSFLLNGVTYLNNTSNIFTSLAQIASHTSVTDKFSSEIIGESIYLLHNESEVKYSTYSKESEKQTYAIGSRESEDFNDSQSSYLIGETSNTTTRIEKDQETRKNPSTIAVGASVDVRVARQFEMDVSGNAKVSARLVSLPAPPEFLDQIKSYYNQ